MLQRVLAERDNAAIALVIEDEVGVGDDRSRPKRPVYHNRRFYLYAIAALLLSTAIVVGVVLGVVKQDNVPQEPTPTLAALYRNIFVSEVGQQVNVNGTPHDLAAEWIISDDPTGLPLDAPNLIQRYHLALFYFLTTGNGEKTWKSCNPPRQNETDRCTFLDIAFSDTSVEIVDVPVLGSTRWLSGSHECEWVGVSCDPTDNVIALVVLNQNITDTPLPTEVMKLPFLQAIALSFNWFTGTIPDIYGTKRLGSLDLQYNALTGTIPDFYWHENGLQFLNLGSNLLTGTISSQLAGGGARQRHLGRNRTFVIRHDRGLYLYDNMLSGTIPSELGSLAFLDGLSLHRNLLNGTIPSELGKLSLLKDLWLWENGMDGKIPSELGSLSDLETLEIYENPLTGTIPEELYNLTKLVSFDVNSCRLTGSLSTNVGRLVNMDLFRVSTNDLIGTIPSELGNMKQARLMWLHKTRFSGTVPASLCNFRPDPLLILQADCNPPSNASVPCSCCSHCCDRDSGICLTVDEN